MVSLPIRCSWAPTVISTARLGGGGSNWYANNDFGTVFRVTTNGLFTTLVSFNGTNGANPTALVLGNDGNMYGITSYGGSNSAGTTFRLRADGELTTLVSFFPQNPWSAVT